MREPSAAALALLARWRPEISLDDLEFVQEGAVELPPAVGRSSTDRFADFNAGSVGSGDLLLDDDEHWVHFRRRALDDRLQ